MALAASAQPAAASSAGATVGDDGRIRTQLVARNDVTLSSQIAARIDRLPLRAGDAFRKGQLLVGFDCALYRAQLHKAQASAKAARKQAVVMERLAKLHSAGALKVEQTRAQAAEAAADAAYMRTQVSACSIRAPFNGRVARRKAAPYEYTTPGKPLLEILDTGHLLVKLIVPSSWLSWLRPGERFTVHVDDLGVEVPAQVKRIGARVDPVSQTVTLSGRIDGDHPRLLPGMSGWARFPHHP